MNPAHVLLLPGWQPGGADHWQSHWQAAHGYARVEQHDWLRPLRGDWIARLEEVLLECDAPAVLLAHGLGCLLVAAWAAHTRNGQRVRAALLVAPLDVQRAALRPLLPSWSPIALQRLPFPSTLVASRNHPHCSGERARQFASAWGSDFIDAGNAEPGLGAWSQGHALLAPMLKQPGTERKSCPAMP